MSYEWIEKLKIDRTSVTHEEGAGRPSTATTDDIFWDSQGPILEHYQERGSPINSARYNEMLLDRLKPEIRSKRRGHLSKVIVLLHDNARPNTAAHTV